MLNIIAEKNIFNTHSFSIKEGRADVATAGEDVSGQDRGEAIHQRPMFPKEHKGLN